MPRRPAPPRTALPLAALALLAAAAAVGFALDMRAPSPKALWATDSESFDEIAVEKDGYAQASFQVALGLRHVLGRRFERLTVAPFERWPNPSAGRTIDPGILEQMLAGAVRVEDYEPMLPSPPDLSGARRPYRGVLLAGGGEGRLKLFTDAAGSTFYILAEDRAPR